MLSTGIDALDAHIGGLVEGRYYLLSGAPGSGKSSAALQFLGAGLEAGDRCAILTQDDPRDLMTQAEYLGYDFRPPAEAERLIVLQYRLDFRRNFARAADPEQVFAELRGHLGDPPPDRLVIDSAAPFLEGGRIGEEALDAFFSFLDELNCTTYLTVAGDLNDSYYRQEYDRLIAGAGGILHFDVQDGQIRELSIRKLRQQARSTDPIRVVIRPGAGLVEHVAARPREELPEAFRRRIVVLTEGMPLPEEPLMALQQLYDVVSFDSIEGAFAELATGRYGALIIAIDPRDTESPFSLTRQLRRAGNGAPIFFFSQRHGLRGNTRARGLRAGGDDFLADDLGPEEFVERIEVARTRGHRRTFETSAAEPPVLQPTDPDGSPVLMREDEFRRVLRDVVGRDTYPFFAVVVLRPADLGIDEAWRILANRLRVKEGDLGARMSDGRISLYLHDVRRRHVDELLGRIVEAHPGMGSLDLMQVYCYPADRTEVAEWLNGESGPVEVTAH